MVLPCFPPSICKRILDMASNYFIHTSEYGYNSSLQPSMDQNHFLFAFGTLYELAVRLCFKKPVPYNYDHPLARSRCDCNQNSRLKQCIFLTTILPLDRNVSRSCLEVALLPAANLMRNCSCNSPTCKLLHLIKVKTLTH